MRIRFIYNVIVLTVLSIVTGLFASSGSGNFSLSYLYLDEDGNRGVNQPTFNLYEGPGISLTDFSYRFDNDLTVSAELKNIILNNRNLYLSFRQAGFWGLSLSHNQYRRVYSFEGDSYTRRHTNRGRLWIYPHKKLKLWGTGGFVGRSGNVTELFDPDPGAVTKDIDYEYTRYSGGIRYNCNRGVWLLAEAGLVNFNDLKNSDYNRTKTEFKTRGKFRLPDLGAVRMALFGGFHRFESKYDQSEFTISSNRGWGGARVDLPQSFSLRYEFVFERTSSDSDYVATDDITNAVYLGKSWLGTGGLTVGYQHGINDDFEDEVNSNSFYFSGWMMVAEWLELRASFGMTAEEVQEGSRLVGDEDRSRHDLRANLDLAEYGRLKMKYANKKRENDNLGTEIDYRTFDCIYSLEWPGLGLFDIGYQFAMGDYLNRVDDFEFTDHTVFGDFSSEIYRGLRGGIGLTYYRSQRDLDVESIILRFTGSYELIPGLSLEAEYNVHNFDDFLVRDKYYTANIVEMKIIKHFDL